ncbi:MAG: 4Fe-4S dicluster domain-containing protein [Candidatus Hodarchaeota archaeon]
MMGPADDVRTQRDDTPIKDDDVVREFKYEVAAKLGGEGLLKCLKCGACSGGCPVAAVTDYRPRKVLGNVLLGLKELVLSSNDIWMCAACFTCEERCVQEVNFTDIITILRNMAVEKGYASKGYVEMAKMVSKHGRVVPKTRAVDRMRQKLNLPPLQDPDMDSVSKILQASGFDKILTQYGKEERTE